MKYIICSDIAPVAVDSLLSDLLHDPDQRKALLDMITESTSEECFKYAKDQIEGHEGCTAICLMVHSLLLEDDKREAYLREDQPQLDFEEAELDSWDGLLLSLQFASHQVLLQLLRELPSEHVAHAIDHLPADEFKAVARTRIFQLN